MRRFVFAPTLLILPLLLAATLPARAQSPQFVKQSWTTSSCEGHYGGTRNYSLFGSRHQFCELRRITLPASGEVKVRDENGGIEVIGQQRNTIELEARVIVQDSSHAKAEATAQKVTIHTDGEIHATGPSSGIWGGPSWYVNYRLYVPENIAAQLHTENGGINLRQLNGKIDAATTNGGLSLVNLNGEVHAKTTNGGLSVTLGGDGWTGQGLWAQTTNGGVNVPLGSHYSAHLDVQNVNGGISVDLPNITKIARHHYAGDLGHGGATLSFRSTNGGVSVSR